VTEYDAIIVGSGPNGLTAAARLASRDWRVLVLERAPTIGGGARTEPFAGGTAVYDVCSAAHPFGAFSSAFAALDLDRHGLEWRHPPLPLAHPFDDGSAAVLERAVRATADGFGLDKEPYHALVEPLLARWPALADGFLGPLLRVPPHPFVMARFGLSGAWSVETLVRRFREPATRGLFAGLAAHSYLPLDRLFTAGIGLSLGLAAHAVGWPVAAGGSQAITDALASVVRSRGGEIVTGHDVKSLHDLPRARATLLDVGPRQFVALAGSRLPGSQARPLQRWRYGPAAFKADYLLSGPLPWTSVRCGQAGTVHLGGRFEEIAAAERVNAAGTMAERPFTLLVQPSVADPSRAPIDQHVVWAYCHVPHGDGADRSPQLEGQLDRFAPGWRDLVVERRIRTPVDLEAENPNDVGGDIAGGSLGGTQLVLRPWAPLHPYRTPIKGVWLCSASTPPGAGAHGMCGWHAAGDVLSLRRRLR
jgi:phytoene dehydrogenase-like protein